MNKWPSEFHIEETVQKVVPHVMRTMLNRSAIPAGKTDRAVSDRITAIIGIGGPTVSGMLYFHFPKSFGKTIVQCLFEVCDDSVLDRQVNDAVGEICNMVAGGLKAALADSGHDTGISPPSIIRGNGFTVEIQSDLEIAHFPFLCEQDVIDFEVHLKFDPEGAVG